MIEVSVKKICYIYVVEWKNKGKSNSIFNQFRKNKKDIEDNVKSSIIKKHIFLEISKTYPEILL